MDDLELVERLVRTLAAGLSVPVTVKIRRFPDLERTLEYACMLERAGASLLGIHGRTRDQKKAKETRADWDVIRVSASPDAGPGRSQAWDASGLQQSPTAALV